MSTKSLIIAYVLVAAASHCLAYTPAPKEAEETIVSSAEKARIEAQLHRELNEATKKISVISERQGYRELFLEIFRLQHSGNTDLADPIVHSLKDFPIPTAWKAKINENNPWPPRASALRDLILSSSLDKKDHLDPLDMGRLMILLRLENEVRGLPFGANANPIQLLRKMAENELEAITKNQQLAKYPLHLPRELRESLRAAALAEKIKLDVTDRDPAPFFSVPMGQMQSLLKAMPEKTLSLNDWATLAGQVRMQARALQGDGALRNDMADLFDTLKQKHRGVSPRNAYRQPIIQGGGQGGGTQYPFFAPTTEEDKPGPEGANACVVSPKTASDPSFSAKGQSEQLDTLTAARKEGQIGFKIQTHTPDSIPGQEKVASCMAGIDDGVGEHPHSKNGEPVRFVMYTATHCVSGNNITSLDILGVATAIPGANIHVEPMPGKSDISVVSIDVPAEFVPALAAQSHRFVTVPSEAGFSAANKAVSTDINFVRPVSPLQTIIGETFAIKGSENFMGVNFKGRRNQGQAIDPGTSGSPVVQRDENGKNIYMGPVSYKCIGMDGIGGIVSGKKVMAFLNDELKRAYTRPSLSQQLADATEHRNKTAPASFNPVHVTTGSF